MKNNYYNQYGRFLLGMGFDASDGHQRITKGEYFKIEGGSEQTHEDMQEKSIKLVETLNKRGKTIVTASDEEFFDTAALLGMNIFSPMDN